VFVHHLGLDTKSLKLLPVTGLVATALALREERPVNGWSGFSGFFSFMIDAFAYNFLP
jgi:hypothetical protein